MHLDRDSGVTAVREPVHHLRRPPPSVVLPVDLLEGEVELAQLRESRQNGPHLVPEEEVCKARAVDPIRPAMVSVATGLHVNCER